MASGEYSDSQLKFRHRRQGGNKTVSLHLRRDLLSYDVAVGGHKYIYNVPIANSYRLEIVHVVSNQRHPFHVQMRWTDSGTTRKKCWRYLHPEMAYRRVQLCIGTYGLPHTLRVLGFTVSTEEAACLTLRT